MPSAPLCTVFDPAERVLYAGLDDGSIQLVDFFQRPPFAEVGNSEHGSSMPSQPSPEDRWSMPLDTRSPTLSLTISYDGTILVSGHEDGRILAWDVAKGKYMSKLNDLQAPVSNLQILEPIGFPQTKQVPTASSSVVKPKYESALSSNGSSGGLLTVPEKYVFTGTFRSSVSVPQQLGEGGPRDGLVDDFEAALTHSSFPSHILDEGIATFSGRGLQLAGSSEADGDLQKEVKLLRAQLAHSKAAQLAHAERAVELNGEVLRLRDLEKVRKRAKSIKRIKQGKAQEIMRKRYMGEEVDPEAEKELARQWEGEAEVSSTTDEMTGGD